MTLISVESGKQNRQVRTSSSLVFISRDGTQRTWGDLRALLEIVLGDRPCEEYRAERASEVYIHIRIDGLLSRVSKDENVLALRQGHNTCLVRSICVRDSL
jgi:hypothetical protein